MCGRGQGFAEGLVYVMDDVMLSKELMVYARSRRCTRIDMSRICRPYSDMSLS